MTEADRVAIVRHIFESFLRGDISPLLAALADDVEFQLTVGEGTPLSGVFRGTEGVIEYFTRNETTVETNMMEVQSYLSGGDQVAVFGVETLTVRRNGAVMKDVEWTTLVTFRGERIGRVVVIEDTTQIYNAYASAAAS